MVAHFLFCFYFAYGSFILLCKKTTLSDEISAFHEDVSRRGNEKPKFEYSESLFVTEMTGNVRYDEISNEKSIA